VPAWVVLALLAVLLGVSVLALWRAGAVRGTALGLTAVFVLCYAVGLRLAPYSQDPVTRRYLAPMFIPAMSLLLVGGYHGYDALTRVVPHQTLRAAVRVLVGVWLVYQASVTVRGMLQPYHHGTGGYRTTPWHTSQLVHWLQHSPWDGIIYSNWHEVL
jgi:hypothetical protein